MTPCPCGRRPHVSREEWEPHLILPVEWRSALGSIAPESLRAWAQAECDAGRPTALGWRDGLGWFALQWDAVYCDAPAGVAPAASEP